MVGAAVEVVGEDVDGVALGEKLGAGGVALGKELGAVEIGAPPEGTVAVVAPPVVDAPPDDVEVEARAERT